MPLHRLIVIVLVALAVAIAPLGAALAGPYLAKHGATDQKAATPAPPDMSGMAAMADCEKMMGKSGSTDCPCTAIRHRLTRGLLDDPVIYIDELAGETLAYPDRNGS